MALTFPEIAAKRKPLVIHSAVLSSIAAICCFVPYLAIYCVIREILMVYPDLNRLNTEAIRLYSFWAVLGILGNLISYYLAILCSHIGAFGTIYDLKIEFADHLANANVYTFALLAEEPKPVSRGTA